MLKNKEGGTSKTKLGTLLVGVGAIFGTLGGWLTGSIDVATAISALLSEIGGVLFFFGVRDIPFFNKGK